MLLHFTLPLPWRQIAKRVFAEINDDNCMGLAAQLSFYFLLGLFPALLFFVALIAYLPIENVLDELLLSLATVAPAEMVELLRTQLDTIADGSHAGLVTLGIVGAIWSSSAAMVAIIDALNRAYDVVEWRPWWKRRLVAIALTIALALFLLTAFVMVLLGPEMMTALADRLGLEPAVPVVWRILRWPVLVCCVVLGVDLVFHFAPNRHAQWSWITPGSALATALWILSSFGFKLYVVNFGNYTATYGAIGGAIVTMLWFYVSGLALLVGAELNAVIEHAQQVGASRSGGERHGIGVGGEVER
jgi:membrane protein